MNDQTTTTGTASPLKRSVLKGKARASLLGHYMPLSSAFLSLAILQYIITAPSGLIQVHPPFGTILYYAVTFAISVFFGIFQVGITRTVSEQFLPSAGLCGRHFLWLLA